MEETMNKAKIRLYEMIRFKDLPTHIKVFWIKASIIPFLIYPPILSYTSSRTTLDNLQVIHNKALRFACNEKYPYIKKQKTLHELWKLEPIENTLHRRAEILKKITEQEGNIFRELFSNCEEKNHQV